LDSFRSHFEVFLADFSTEEKGKTEKEMWPYRFFTEKEMRCKCGCGHLPEHDFMEALDAMRAEAGFPFVIASGARCSDYNNQISDSGINGPHTKGAADIRVWGYRAFKIIELAIKYKMTGIGIHQKGAMGDRFIHVDKLKEDALHPRPWPWSY